MATKNITYTEEIGDSKRVTSMKFDDTTGDVIRPDDRMLPAAIVEWDRVMALLQNVDGEDLTPIINHIALMDYCTDIAVNRPHRKRGT